MQLPREIQTAVLYDRPVGAGGRPVFGRKGVQ